MRWNVAPRGALVLLLVTVAFAGCTSDDPAVCGPTEICSGDTVRAQETFDITCSDGALAARVEDCEGGNVTAPVEALPWYPNDGASEAVDMLLPSFDDHEIPLTVHRPLIANATMQVPVLLHSHGFTGARAAQQDHFQEYIAAGFAVVSFDERGHGDARESSEVHFMNPDWEVQDVLAIIDEVATWDWVLMEDETTRDPVLGALGGSYGGAYQLMAAAFDDRLDAIVPEITWNDITHALAPGGAVKSGWVDLFYLAGNAQGSVTFSEDFHRGWAYANAANEFPAGQAPGVPDLYTQMQLSSPAAYPGAIRIPTLLVQGMSDTLFPLNEAAANLALIEATGAPTALYTHLDGHILHTDSLAPGTSPTPAGLQGVAGGRPCGNQTALDIAWHQTHLLGQDAWDQPRVCIALEDETALMADAFPLPDVAPEDLGLGGPHALPQAPVGASVPIEALSVDKETVLAGIPRLNGTITVGAPEAIIYLSLRVQDRQPPLEAYVNDQVMPLRIAGPVTDAAFELELGGIGTRLQPGDVLELHVSHWEPMYFANAGRAPGLVVLDDLRLHLPVVG